MAAALAHLSDGSTLQTSWNKALSDSIQHFKQLLTAQSSRSWKHLSTAPATTSSSSPSSAPRDFAFDKSASGLEGRPQVSISDVKLDRRTNKSGDVFRGTLEVPLGDGLGGALSVELIRAVLETPELRSSWDRLVDEALTLDLLDVNTRVVQTKYKLGWPASPRDSITIAKVFNDDRNVVIITTSLPRSTNEPVYLRPSPPHVRAHVNLLAYCVQFIPEPNSSLTLSPSRSARSKALPKPKTSLKITCYWQWDPKGSFLVGGWIPQHMPTLLVNFYTFLQSQLAASIPTLSSYGKHITIDRVDYDVGKGALNVDYAIVKEGTSSLLLGESTDAKHAAGSEQADDEEDHSSIRDKGKIMRTLDFGVSAAAHWDVQVSFKSSSGSSEPYVPVVQRSTANVIPYHAPRLNFRITHGPLPADKDIVRVNVALERTAGAGPGLRVNGMPLSIEEPESREIVTAASDTHLFDDTVSISEVSTFSNEISETRTVNALALDGSPGPSARPRLLNTPSLMSFRGRAKRTRTPAEEKHIGSTIRRNYIYFTSLLQEPEAKWNSLNETRGVSTHQLRSIDPTVIVYRAESTVVGASLWDVYAVISTWGCRAAWDKAYEDALLLEDLGECTELWECKSRQSWPSPARETILLRTTYRSENSIHVFGLTTYDRNLFPSIPATDDVSRVRVHTELNGWALERLSPNTVQITAIEQYDSNSSISRSAAQAALVSAVAGARETALRGNPPIITRLGTGARVVSSSYDMETAHARFEYAPTLYDKSAELTELSVSHSPERQSNGVPSTPSRKGERTDARDRSAIPPAPEQSHLELEVRFEESWANAGTDILVDPPPARISALRRHRLSPHGGLWLSIEHDRAAIGSEGVHISLRRDNSTSSSAAKDSVKVNGIPLKVDYEDLSQVDVQALKRQKRGIPTRLPLDRPPVTTPKLRRFNTSVDLGPENSPSASAVPRTWLETPGIKQMTMPVTYSMMLGSALLSSGSGKAGGEALSPTAAATQALQSLVRLHQMRDGESTMADAWAVVSKAEGVTVEKKVIASISDTAYTFRTGRILEGFGADEILAGLTARQRRDWDPNAQAKLDLLAYGNGTSASFFSSSPSTMFRPRGFLTAQTVGRLVTDGTASPSTNLGVTGRGTVVLVASRSFDERTISEQMDPSTYNPLRLPLGKVLMEGWILEELDPYAHDKYEIPSTRVMYVSCVEYGGSMPVAYGNILAAAWPFNLGRLHAFMLASRLSPILSSPPVGALVIDSRASGEAPASISLEEGETNRALVDLRMSGQDEYRLLILLRPTIGGHSRPDSDENPHTGSGPALPGSPARTNSGSLVDLAAKLREAAALRNLSVAEFTVNATPGKDRFTLSVTSACLSLEDSRGMPPMVDFAKSVSTEALPYAVTIQDSPSPLRTTSRDKSGTLRSYGVKVQLDLPQSKIGDPLTGRFGQTEQVPEHPDLDRLRRAGALVEVRLTRVSGDLSTDIPDSGAAFTCAGKPIVTREASLALPEKRKLPRLRLGGPSADTEAGSSRGAVTLDLQPLAVNAAFAREKAKIRLVSVDPSEPPIPALPTSAVIALPTSPEAPVRPSPARSASMYERWGMVLPRRMSKARPTPLASLADEKVRELAAPSAPAVTAVAEPLVNIDAALELNRWHAVLTRPRYSAATLLLIAAATFLLGSLVRGFLHADEDFIMFGSLDAGPRLSESEWKVLRKIMGLKLMGWHIVLGAYRANQGG